MGDVRAPKLLRAELFQRELPGQSRALLISARDEDGLPVDCITKLDVRLKCTPTEHLREWLGCALGAVLGINVPKPYRVEISAEFARAIGVEGVRQDALRSVGFPFGCEVFASYTQWFNGATLPIDLRVPAAELLAFDIFIHNVDRRAQNHNVMVGRADIAAFDHGDAFSFIFPNFGAPPPEVDALEKVVEQHVFRSSFRGTAPPVAGFCEALKQLTDDVFDEIRSVTPAEWQVGLAAGKLDEIIRVLRARRDAVDKWLPVVEQWVRK